MKQFNINNKIYTATKNPRLGGYDCEVNGVYIWVAGRLEDIKQEIKKR